MRELSENREELAGQKEELKSQNVTEIQARFENSFFNLLETQRVIARSIIMDDNEFNNYKSPHLYKDKNIFKFLVENEIKMNMDRCIIYASQLNDEETNFKNILITKSSERLKFLVEKFNDISFIKDGRFDSYFRLTYRILKFVDEFDFDKVSEVQLRNLRLITNNHTHKSRKLIKNKSKSIKLNYTGLLRSQIGIYEQVMIFYNALNPKYAKCKKLIEKYNMFNSLRTSMLANVQDTLLYKLSAFGKLTYSRKVGGKNIDFNIQILDIDKFYDFIMHMRTRPLKAEEIDNINILFKYWLRGIIKNENYKFEECEILGLGWKK